MTNCQMCGADLSEAGIRRQDARFCSVKCRSAAHRAGGYRNPPRPPRPPKIRHGTCIICGASFQAGPGGVVGVTCSPKCRVRRDTLRRDREKHNASRRKSG